MNGRNRLDDLTPQDEYAWYLEIWACQDCDGMGEDDDGFICNRCAGFGVSPDAPEYDGPPPI